MPLAGGGARGIGSGDLDIIRGTEALVVIALVRALVLARLRLPPLPLAIPIDLELWCFGSFLLLFAAGGASELCNLGFQYFFSLNFFSPFSKIPLDTGRIYSFLWDLVGRSVGRSVCRPGTGEGRGPSFIYYYDIYLLLLFSILTYDIFQKKKF